MANPSKKKGTGGETELLRLFAERGVTLVRTPPGTLWDLEMPGESPIQALATRPDRGEWLVTVDLPTFIDMAQALGFVYDVGLRVEVKRYARFALHSIWDKKFGRKA